ncbi:tetratricopeptide repeat protein [Pelosinus sp. IPA-1]|uniref:tetratricopeptide repeat protein n=1 Tax=Pelosinus sp. IPA-1 TaxID=3029569 RepID=UPI00243619E3|nr:tetratricopeptide repeat protein [Pelosinus sp. IPA-1]GMB02134.1 hypothetical protein PIPA1_49340 [Pelosinus sp. IPA-1]
MGIFSSLFSKNTESSSNVRKWVAREIETVDRVNPDVYALFVGLIHNSIQCGKHNTQEEDKQLHQVAMQYLGDATIFEIACYTYYRVEDWLAQNQPNYKPEEVALPIKNWIVEKFYTTFYLEEDWVRHLLEEQLKRYKDIAGTEKNIERLHLELEKRILATRGDKFNKDNSPKDPARAAVDSQYIKSSLANYEENYIPVTIESIADYCKKNTNEQLIQQQNQAKKLREGQGDKDYLYGMALLAQKDWVRACNAFTKVLLTNPDHYDALVQRGLLYIIQYQHVDALRDFTRAVEVNPNEPAAYLHRGKCYHRNLRLKDKSLADYSQAIALAPKDAKGYLGRGELYDDVAMQDERQAAADNDQEKLAFISKEFLAAIHDYSQVITLEPEHDDAYAKRALLYARKARVSKNIEFIENAINDFERAISLNWEHGYLYKQQDEMKELLEEHASYGV